MFALLLPKLSKLVKLYHHSATRPTVSPNLLQRAAIACVLPVAYYGSETWWPGRSRLESRGRISNSIDSLLQQLSLVILYSARATLPAYKTTPTASLHRESGLLTPEIQLNARATAATIRIRRLDKSHPL